MLPRLRDTNHSPTAALIEMSLQRADFSFNFLCENLTFGNNPIQSCLYPLLCLTFIVSIYCTYEYLTYTIK